MSDEILESLDKGEIKYVFQKGLGFVDGNDPASRFIETSDFVGNEPSFGSCVCLVVHSPETKITGMLHADTTTDIPEAVRLIKETVGEKANISIVGGQDNKSENILKDIQTALKTNSEWNVENIDILGSNKKSRQVVVDSSNGQIFNLGMRTNLKTWDISNMPDEIKIRRDMTQQINKKLIIDVELTEIASVDNGEKDKNTQPIYDSSNLFDKAEINNEIPTSQEKPTDNEARILTSLENLLLNKDALYNTPRLPNKYIKPGPKRLEPPKYTPKRPDPFHPLWHNIENPEALDQWAIDSGFDSLEDIYEDLPYELLINQLQPVGKLKDRLKNIKYQKKISVIGIIERTRMFQTSQMMAEKSILEGKELIQRHLPSLIPKEDTIIVGRPGYSNQQGENGEYFGKVGNKHIIYMNTPPDPYMKLEDTDSYGEDMDLLPVLGAHELMHQRHAEAASILLGAEIDETEVSEKMIMSESQASISKHAKEREEDSNESNANNIMTSVAEGVATGAEILIALKERDRNREIGNTDEANRFFKAIKARMKLLRAGEKAAIDEPYSAGTINIVGELFRTMDLDELTTFIENVDLATALEIQEGSDEYDAIIKDPHKLPML